MTPANNIKTTPCVNATTRRATVIFCAAALCIIMCIGTSAQQAFGQRKMDDDAAAHIVVRSLSGVDLCTSLLPASNKELYRSVRFALNVPSHVNFQFISADGATIHRINGSSIAEGISVFP